MNSSIMSKGLKLFSNTFEMKEKGKATFQSYIDLSDDEEEEDDNEEVEDVASSFFKDRMEPGKLQGERVVAAADSVLMFTKFTNFKKGMSGNLFVTNFKISFVTADKSSYLDRGATPNSCQRNKLLDNTDITLANIDAIYQVGSGARRKKITPGNLVTTPSKYLEIHCKDYQIHTFGFKFTEKDQNLRVTNTLLCYASPVKENLLFAYDFAEHSGFDEPMHIHFQSREHWQNELKRLSCDIMWRVADVNVGYQMSTSLPEYFVTPYNLLNSDLNKASGQYPDKRVPTWSYTYSNGASLLRMTPISPESDMKHVEERFFAAIKQSSGGENDPLVMDLGRECPSLSDIRSAHDRLKNHIVIDSEKEFVKSDSRWYSNLENCQWLQHVSTCLSVANRVVDYLSRNCQTVILKEESGSDLSCVIASLVQLQLDPHYHTIDGFQTLIEKEWVIMGHQFQKRLHLVSTPDTKESDQVPVFLLFLDCVWQLLQQFPSIFAFTETYLTTVLDTLNIGIFHTFHFNNCWHRAGFVKATNHHLPSAWNWKFQFSEDQQMLFNNPLYMLRTSFDLDGLINRAKTTLCQSGERLRENRYSMQLSLPDCVSDLSSIHASAVKSEVSLCFVKLWSQCYLRWAVPARIVGGGNPSQYLQQCILAEEVVCLQHKLSHLSRELQSLGVSDDADQEGQYLVVRSHKGRKERPYSGLVFGVNGYQSSGVPLSSVYITSSYPFNQTSSENYQSSLISGSLSRYLKDTAIDHDYDQDQDLID